MNSAQHMLRTGRRGPVHEFQMAGRDLLTSLIRIKLAWSLAWHDVVAKYRGSVLGPFWITLSMGVMVLGIGVLYAQLFKLDLREFVPYVAIGIVTWGMISGVIIEGCDTFIQAAGMLRQTSLPLFTFTWRSVLRNLINLAHHLVIILVVLVWYGSSDGLHILAGLGGLVLLILNVSWMGMLAGIVSARFRDVPQIVISVVQFAMFMTPVFWRADQIPERHFVLAFNPFYYMLDAVRSPLLGLSSDTRSLPVLLLMALVGWLVTLAVFTMTRRRIVHYL